MESCLPMTDKRPNFRLTRCCLNCFYFSVKNVSKKKIPPLRGAGYCAVHKAGNSSVQLLKTHAMLVCDAHIWRNSGTFIPKTIQKYNVDPPQELI